MISFEEGRKKLAQSGLPATCFFLLSTKSETDFLQTDTLAGGVGEATGTGYARQSQALPTPTTANPTAISFVQMTWSTGSATDWPVAVKSVVLVTTTDNTGVAVAAWNVNGTSGFPMNAASTTLQDTPTLDLS